ncbi:dehydratase [Ectothiorhodospira haloalkaliphila]|uniref:Dehydratase n=1 Tax=Ectothiorhodospira haloalkaliphila TaxID=421628 RepID=W8KKM9_9GAMM|nr:MULTISPECIES: MaoC family dehydratase [Ectothiorhodospira]AHK80354.1 dehydratase [Ectothiorhodospira haloalkaliphila]MCG5492968.1 MaoC family dehydratase [Ectothiorhodospira variabilis]MCG5497311.1 MaoC family dehydratase [Ectothiorhodospira variabilis]MCG5502297.1 MaoC family dehydratase [Ectothiorhodospira variabilis]MCG5505937.1 MaoC family dehydratase [Ectothiorhodospira variabilis]
MSTYYLEDLQPGMRFSTGPHEMTEADIIRFGEEYDPQPHHVDPVAARNTFFRGLVASGWHTISVMTAMAIRSDLRMAEGQIGIAVEGIRFIKAVRPGDRITLHMEIREVKASESRPGWGVIKVLWTAINQAGEPVLELQPSILVKARERVAPSLASAAE